MKKKTQKKSGVTFIELLVSSVILALTLMSLLNVFSATRRLVSISDSRMSVAEIGKFVLDPLQMQVRQDQWGANCLSTGVGCLPNIVANQNKDYNVAYTVTNNQPIANVNRVRIDVSWTEN